MNIPPFLTIVIVICAIAAFLALKYKRQFLGNIGSGSELNYLYEYKNFLLKALEIKNQLQIKLAAISYNSLQYETFFSPFEITILKNQINNSIEELEEMILNQSISAGDFYIKTDQLSKRIELISLPLAAMADKLGDDFKHSKIVA